MACATLALLYEWKIRDYTEVWGACAFTLSELTVIWGSWALNLAKQSFFAFSVFVWISAVLGAHANKKSIDWMALQI